MKVERVEQVYAEIAKCHITLSSDPASLGPKYLQDQIATCRDHINNVTKLLMEVHREKHNLTAEIHTAETMLKVESDNLLTNDKRVRDLPNIKDRESAIALLLRTQVQTIADMKARMNNLDFVEKAVRHTHRELRDTMSEIKLQRSLMRDEIDTKSFYGNERESPEPMPDDGLEGADIDALMNAVHEEQKAARAKHAPESEPVDEPPSTEGMFCGVCGEPQFNCPSGIVCKNGHGDAPTVTQDEAEAIKYMADLDAPPEPPPQPKPAAPPPALSASEDAAIDEFLAEGDDIGAPATIIVAEDDFSDILDTV